MNLELDDKEIDFIRQGAKYWFMALCQLSDILDANNNSKDTYYKIMDKIGYSK